MKPLNIDFVCTVLKEHALIDDDLFRQIKLHEQDYREQLQKKSAGNGSSQITSVDIIHAMKLHSVKDPDQELSEALIMKTLASHWQLPFFQINVEKLDARFVISKVSEPFATTHLAIPISLSKRMLFVAVINPLDVDILDTLRNVSKLRIRPVISTKSDILNAIEACYHPQKPVVPAEEVLDNFQAVVQAVEQQYSLESLSDKAVAGDEKPSEDKHIVNVLNLLLNYALEQRTTEIHIEPKRQCSAIRFRIDGILYDVTRISSDVYSGISQRLKALASMNISEKRKPQDGRMQLTFHNHEIHLRISTLPVTFGEKLMLRVFDPMMLLRHIDELGFSSEELEQYLTCISSPNGIVLIAGPTGSGKTTTLYSTLNRLAEAGINVITLEDPVELPYEGFNQIMLQPAAGFTFETAIRHIVRQSPDVIMIGEIRDTESVKQTIQAALTGHLVVSTIHTADAPSALIRLVDMGAQPFLVESTVVAVIAQRLIRKICTTCAEPYQLSPQEIIALQKSDQNSEEECFEFLVQKGTGCEQCRGTGYWGQIALFELMRITDPIRALIHTNAGAYAIRNAAIQQGMRPLRTQALEKMKAGLTTCEEILRITGGLKKWASHKFKSKILWSSP